MQACNSGMCVHLIKHSILWYLIEFIAGIGQFNHFTWQAQYKTMSYLIKTLGYLGMAEEKVIIPLDCFFEQR